MCISFTMFFTHARSFKISCEYLLCAGQPSQDTYIHPGPFLQPRIERQKRSSHNLTQNETQLSEDGVRNVKRRVVNEDCFMHSAIEHSNVMCPAENG